MPEVHKAFESSGKAQGLEVWRIENFEPVAVPKHQYGCFFTGDSYIVLKTSGTSTLSWDVHFWLGSSTSQDEAGAAAILTVNLDEGQFGGAAIQHRETQGHESRQFLGYFKPAIRYLDGGHASAFSHVTVNAGSTKRLFQVKGRRNVRLRQVPPEVSSMNKGDCFILDVDHDIYLYIGEKSNRMEKLNASMILNQLKDQDHHGRANVEIIDAYSHEGDEERFFAALGSGDKDSIPDATEGGDDEEFDRGSPEDATLCEISDKTGDIKITKLSKPNKKGLLDTKECYVLDTGSSIYVWVGKNSNQKEKDAALKRAEHYLRENNYPSWVHVSKIPEGNEPAAFKKYFQDWN